MYTDQHRDRRPVQGEQSQQQQLNHLVAAGLLGTQFGGGTKIAKGVGFKTEVKDTRSKESRTSQKGLADRRNLRPPPTVRSTSDRRLATLGTEYARPSSLVQLKERRNSMFAGKGRETRRERTFIGSDCAACEEPLEHTLRGERVLQLSCSHVAHEACFYEYIKEFEAQTCPCCSAPLGVDTSRGGGIDFENLNRLVRSAQNNDIKDRFRDLQATPTPWETDTIRQNVQARQRQQSRSTREHLLPEQPQPRTADPRYDRYNGVHGRNESGETTGATSTNDYAETHQSSGRRHDYDLQSMEASVTGPKHSTRNPIPPPTVTIRSEFPTLSKSRQQQSLTCLVTVEVVDGKWRASADDLRSPPSMPPTIPEEGYEQSSSRETMRRAEHPRAAESTHENLQVYEAAKEELYKRVDNWHGLDFARFGRLLLHGTVRVGKDKQAWQELECYLFTEMLICVKEKKVMPNASQQWDDAEGTKQKPRCTLKGSILIKKHLKQVEVVPDHQILTLSLSVAELPHFHLQFQEYSQLDTWRRALININRVEPPTPQTAEFDHDTSGTDEEDYSTQRSRNKRVSSVLSSSNGASRSQVTAPTEYTNSRFGVQTPRPGVPSLHIPHDIVVVIPVSASMQGLKINLLRDSLRFLVSSLGERDRMGLVTFGSGGGGVPLVGMTTKTWSGWSKVIESIRPLNQKSMRADVVEGANVAMDLLMQRKSSNPLSSILLISDSATSDQESVDFVVSRAEAAKIAIHSFGLGLTHKPDTMVELSTRTKASYTYVKDWMMLRECLAGCLGALQSTSHQNVKLKLRLPEGSPAKFVKISGALQVTKRATGRDAEALLGDLRFGDKRDILVQLAIAPDTSTPDTVPSDAWENVIAGLEALSGSIDSDDSRTLSVEELPLIQADPDRANHLLAETRSILKGLGKGGLPPLPPPPNTALPPTPKIGETRGSPTSTTHTSASSDPRRTPSPPRPVIDAMNPFTPAAGIDPSTMAALDAELVASLEWIAHPTVFGRDSRKAVLQAIGVISSQRGFTYRTPAESLWAGRIAGVKRLAERSREWREEGPLVEEEG
ncbi:hypothetical protein LTR48_004651 [Friedmanniomyces endolithicus]|nr:hypothetical protein LTR48_004651 [Friedmanniomyces endolithicus]